MTKEQDDLIIEALLKVGILKNSRQGIIRRWANKKVDRIKRALLYAIVKSQGGKE